MSNELRSILRFLHKDSDKWLGCGFLVPSPPEDNAVHVMTCAHVVAEMLSFGQSQRDATQYSETAPTGELRLHFNGAREFERKIVRGHVVAENWRRCLRPDEAATEAYDIAVVRLDTDLLPDGADPPAFQPEPLPGMRVMAHGPRHDSDLRALAEGNWAEGHVRGAGRLDQITFLSRDDIPNDKVIGGFSGGPLIKMGDGFEIVGMVRSTVEKETLRRSAFALPIRMLSKVCPPKGSPPGQAKLCQ